MTLIATVLNKLGLPAKSFGVPLVVALVGLNLLYVLLVRRPRIDWRKALCWGGAFLAMLLMVGWPLIVAGYNWVGFGNGDMTVYLLGANHFYAHGFYQLPDLHALLRDTHPSWDFSFFYSIAETRSASQLVLALFMAVTSLTAAQGYMILMLAFALVMLSAAAALVCVDESRERVAFAALLVIGSSAVLADGTINQLMPQAFGIAIVAASACVLLNALAPGPDIYRQATLAGLFLATQLVAYPEMLPFIVLSAIVYAAIAVFKRELPARRWLLFIGLSAAATLVGANVAVFGGVRLLVWATSANSGAAIGALFPYYLTPLGFALGWGSVHLGSSDVSSWRIQALVVVGAALYVIAVCAALRGAARLEPIAIVSATMLLLFIALFARGNGFGLFKLAMYAQPFVLGTLTIAVGSVFSRLSDKPVATAS